MKVDYLSMCIGRSLRRIGHAADMIWIIIGDVSVHLSANSVISLDGQILTKTDDLYFDYEEKLTPWVHRCTLFDKKIATLCDQPRHHRVLGISIDPELNLCINFSDGLLIKTLTSEYIDADSEKWRFLIKGSTMPHMVARGNSIDWD